MSIPPSRRAAPIGATTKRLAWHTGYCVWAKYTSLVDRMPPVIQTEPLEPIRKSDSGSSTKDAFQMSNQLRMDQMHENTNVVGQRLVSEVHKL